MGNNRAGNPTTLVRFGNLGARQRVYTRRTLLKAVKGIWLNESLTPAREKMSFKARTLFKTQIVARNWTFLGNVFIKMTEDSDPIKVNDFASLCAATGITDTYEFPKGPGLPEPGNDGVDYTVTSD